MTPKVRLDRLNICDEPEGKVACSSCWSFMCRRTHQATREAPLTAPTLSSWTLTLNTSSLLKGAFPLLRSLTPEAPSLHLHRGQIRSENKTGHTQVSFSTSCHQQIFQRFLCWLWRPQSQSAEASHIPSTVRQRRSCSSGNLEVRDAVTGEMHHHS